MKKRKIEVPLQNGKELKPIMIKPNMGRIIKPMAKFPDLSGDGKVTKKDILMGKGVIDKPKMYNKPKNKVKKDTPERLKIKKTGRELQNALIKEQNKPVTKQDKNFINQLKGGIEELNKQLSKTKPKPTMKRPKMYNKPKMKKGKHSLGKDVVAEYAKKGISEKILNTFGTTSSDTVTVKSRNYRGINPRAGAALKLSGKKSGTVKGLYSSGKEIMTRGQGKKEKIAYAMGDRTYTQDNKKELAGKVMMYKSKPKMYNKPKYYGKKKK